MRHINPMVYTLMFISTVHYRNIHETSLKSTQLRSCVLLFYCHGQFSPYNTTTNGWQLLLKWDTKDCEALPVISDFSKIQELLNYLNGHLN